MSMQQRRTAAARYRPAQIELLIVAEAPPCSTDRYFYFEDVTQHDWLFRYVWEGLAGEKPNRDQKALCLRALRDAGIYLIDLHEENISKPSLRELQAKVPDLVNRCRELRPRRVVLIKSSVYDAAFEALAAANLPVINERIPFPASGQQKSFLERFRRATAAVGFEHDLASAVADRGK